jgi:hypothetical protein
MVRFMDGSLLWWGYLLLSVALVSVSLALLKVWRSRMDDDDDPVDFHDVI